jgi:hypothetical protein
MTLAAGFELLIVGLGHLAIWCAVYNQLHATAWPRTTRKAVEKVIYAIVAAIAIWQAGVPSLWANGLDAPENSTAQVYRWICLIAAAAVTTRWIFRRATARAPRRLTFQLAEPRDMRREFARLPLHGVQAHLLNLIPGNQVFRPTAEFHSMALAGLPRESDGLRIVHLSDLHLTGKVGIEFFQRTISWCNNWEPDLVMLSGDVVDKRKCLTWLTDTLGLAKARLGRFYVLGNHDRRIKPEADLRRAIEATGFEPLNGRWRKLVIAGGCLWLCGNELPWYRGAENLVPEPPDERAAPRILLAHTPDLYCWAERRNFDLMLAGHCHGGQIRLPFIGPIISPSRHGVRFASGTFEFDRLTLRVTRGLSADDPIRLNCPPEITVIDLRAIPR